MSIYEQYISLISTRNFLKSLAVSDRPDYQIMAKSLLNHFPSEEESAMLVRLQEEHYNNLWKPHNEHYPIEYRPEYGGWIFWDETWANWHGPFSNLEEAQGNLDKYAKELNGVPEEKPRPFGFYYDKDAGGK